MAEVEIVTRCPECNSPHLVRDYERAEVICEDCGLVLDEQLIDEGPEWRAFDSEQREARERAGPPSSIMSHDKGLSTQIGWRNKDAYGRTIPHRSRAQIYRLRKWQHRIRTSRSGERSLAQGLTEINTMASKMGLPRHVRESAAVLYRKASTKNLVRGRSIDEVVAATLYAACRQCGVPRTLDEIANKSAVERKSIGRTYRTLTRALGLKLLPQSPRDYIPRFCNKLGLDMEVQRKALDILDAVEREELASGVAPSGVAAATIYIAAMLNGRPCTQKDVAEVAGVTEVTIRNRYKAISEALGYEVHR
ncbi:MAG: transcription initiation factor IIB [Candidatus Thermoplasmatota archaeon]|jgi:transcription initiation factor TFIIB|nr:transcription initiation factor IIB [Candidatus Thermoplasmatota archaeon]